MIARAAAILAGLAVTVAVAWAGPAESEKRGLALYQSGRYAEAAVELESAYVAAPSVRVGFALAQALRKADNCPRALTIYQQLVAQVDGDTRAKIAEAMAPCEEEERARAEAERAAAAEAERAARAEAERLAAEAQRREAAERAAEAARQAEAARRAAEAEARRRSAARRRWHRDPVGGALVGVGAVGLGVGVAGFALARSHFALAADASTDVGFQDERAAGQRWNRRAVIGTAVGGGLLVAGVVRYALVARRQRADALAMVRIDLDGEAARIVGHWRW